jgi:hypothetical protein
VRRKEELKHLFSKKKLREATDRAEKLLIFIKCSGTQMKWQRANLFRLGHQRPTRNIPVSEYMRKFKRILI